MWARCRNWLLPAMVEDTEEHVLAELSTNRAQLWPGRQSAMVTQLVKQNELRLHVWLAGGDLADLLSMTPGVEAWGRQQGCTFATINGRKGWARLLRSAGFFDVDGELRKTL